MATLTEYRNDEARVFESLAERLVDEISYFERLNELYHSYDVHTQVIRPEGVHIRSLACFCHARLYAAVLAYMRGQRGDSFAICRGAIEAALNAFLLHTGKLSVEAFKDGGSRVLDVYRTLKNRQHVNYSPELEQLLATREKLSRWGSHADFSSVVFRLSNREVGGVRFSFFDIEENPKDFRFQFISVVHNFSLALDVFLVIHSLQGDEWAGMAAEQLYALRVDMLRHIRETLGFLQDYVNQR